MRIAFVTPELSSATSDKGGLGSYVARVSEALRQRGHEVEIFVPTAGPGGVSAETGVRIERVPLGNPPRAAGGRGFRLDPVLEGFRRLGRPRPALALAGAFERRDAEAPFDAVELTNIAAAGLYLPIGPGCRSVLRLSCDYPTWSGLDGRRWNPEKRFLARAQAALIRGADAVYAPSEAVAEIAGARSGREIGVIRPPAFVETAPASSPPTGTPDRYLIHFGQIGRRKGSEDLARALPEVWRDHPELTMVWAGPEIRKGALDRYRRLWGEGARRVSYLGAVPKAALYRVLQGAEAAVLPSRMDNLPNTAIESLLFDVPVIGTHGSSVDELVEDGASGALVPPSDPGALAEAMGRVWRREPPWLGSGFRRPAILAEMAAERAADRLLALAGGAGDEVTEP